MKQEAQPVLSSAKQHALDKNEEDSDTLKSWPVSVLF